LLEDRLRVFENRVLRKVFGSQRNKIIGQWRKLRKEQLYDLYSYYSFISIQPLGRFSRNQNSVSHIILVNKYRRMRWAGHLSRKGDKRGAYRVFFGKTEEKRPLGRPKCKWKDNIKMYLHEVGCSGKDSIDLARDRDSRWAPVNAVVKLWVPQNEEKF
jgi:hypothetical protein